MNNVTARVSKTVAMNGPVPTLASPALTPYVQYVQLLAVRSLNGGPAFRITPENTYSKQDVRNSAVFSEFFISDSSWPTTGGMYQVCSRTVIYAMACTTMQIAMRPSSGVSTFRETSPDMGRFM